MILLQGKKLAVTAMLLFSAAASFGQSANGQINTVTTAVPFLLIPGDARSMGMGQVGIAISPDANGAQLNGSKMAFVQQDFGVGLSFTPWLKSLVGDIYLANLAGYYRIKDVQTIFASLRYFSLGQIQYTDDQGNNTIAVHPNEFFFDFGYTRRINNIASVGATLRFIYSNIAPDAGTNTEAVKPGIAGAADVNALVDKIFDNKSSSSDLRHELLWGICISNIGSKMTYTSSTVKDFLPTNLGIGWGYKLHLDPKDDNTVGVYADFNKLMVPTPSQVVSGSGGSYEYSEHQQNESPITGMITSFYDAPGGALEELRSITAQIGAEYYFKKIFGFRMGYFYENPYKGDRQFLTVGGTIKYSVAALHFSYYVPTNNQKDPLDNTFSFSLSFDFKRGGIKKAPPAETDNTGVAPETPSAPKKKKSSSKTEPAPDSSPDPLKQ